MNNNNLQVTNYMPHQNDVPINQRLQPLGARQRLQKMKEVMAKVQQEGPTHMQIWWRRGDDEGWSASQGTVAFNASNALVWCDDNGDVNEWPPLVNQLASIDYSDIVSKVSQVASHAEDNINFVASSAQHATHQVANTATQALSAQAQFLANEQQAFNTAKQVHFQGYDTARTQIEEERIALAKWKAELAEKEKALTAKDEEIQKAAGDEREELEKEKERMRTETNESKSNYEAIRKDYEKLVERASKAAREMESAKRRSRMQGISNLLDQPMPQQRPLMTIPSYQQTVPLPRRQQHYVPPPPRQPPRPKITFSDTDEEDEDDYYEDERETGSMTSFGTVRSSPSRMDLNVECDAYAFEPKQWKGTLSPDVIDRLLTYLRRIANVKTQHWSEYMMEDLLIILRGLLHTLQAVPAMFKSEQFVVSVRTILKRIFIFRETNAGHGAAYVKAFSEAVDNAERPAWIRAAQRQARKDTTTTTPVKPPKKG